MSTTDELKRIDLEPRSTGITTTRSDADQAQSLGEAFNQGRWKFIKEICEISIVPFVKEFPRPNFTGASIVISLYYGAQAYKATGDDDKYIACLKILYSLEPYGHTLGGNYRRFLDAGSKEYVSLADTKGFDYLNNFSVAGLFKGKSGCFIATACYGSDMEPEVILLRNFRDDVLLKRLLGRLAVSLYYRISPSIATVIVKRPRLRKFIRLALIDRCVNAVAIFKANN